MKSARQVAFILCAATLSSQIGCVGQTDLDGVAQTDIDAEVVGESQQGTISHNAITLNAVTLNAVTLNAVTLNALTADSLLSNPLTEAALREPSARELLSFVVSCALPSGTSLDVEVDGTSYSYSGQIGLAPEWGRRNGTCNEECKTWVSGCIIARINYLGEHVPISIRGNHRALYAPPSEQRAFPSREATFYGDIFSSPQRLFACLSPGATQIPRVCGPDIEECGLDVVGSCDDFCKRPRPDGSFPSCRNVPVRRPSRGYSVLPVGAETYKGSVTVFLR